jgi:hypothetical protein
MLIINLIYIGRTIGLSYIPGNHDFQKYQPGNLFYSNAVIFVLNGDSI